VEVNVMPGLFFLLDQCRQCFITSCFVTHLVLTAEHSHMHNLGWIGCNYTMSHCFSNIRVILLGYSLCID
jgi:hypothetical protein